MAQDSQELLAPSPFPVLVHAFPSLTPGTCAYEYVAAGLQPAAEAPRGALVFIGGLGDGPHTVPFIRTVAARLAEDGRWSVFEVRMASAFAGWGYGSLATDVADLGGLAAYLRQTGRTPVVFMGHSTGAQDCVAYAADHEQHGGGADGYILQGPVSDRQIIESMMPRAELDASLAYAQRLITGRKGQDIMPGDMLPPDFKTPVTAYRWHSLAAVGGDDDFFSSDLSDDRIAAIWRPFRKPVLVLPSEKDEHLPASVDVAELLERWRRLAPPGIVSPLSGFIPGADHGVSQASAQKWTAETVLTFLRAWEWRAEAGPAVLAVPLDHPALSWRKGNHTA